MSDDNSITTIDLLRHGQCKDGNCYRGSIDVKLTPEGYDTMWSSLGLKRKEGVSALPTGKYWQRVISSPLIRCAKFASKLTKQYDLPLAVEPALQEMHFGDWEGQSIHYIWATQSAAVERWYEDPVKFPPPNGEAADVFFSRVSDSVLSLAKRYQGEHVLLITHGGVIRAILAHALAMPLGNMNRFDVPYGCFSRIQLIRSEDNTGYYYRLLGHNMTNTP